MKRNTKPFFDPALFIPELADLCRQNEVSFDPAPLMAAMLPFENFETHARPIPKDIDRREISIRAGKKVLFWQTESLRSLLWGDAKPPLLSDCPAAYEHEFELLDVHLSDFSRLFRCPSDTEPEEILATMRRRPNGKCLGYLHDQFWRVSASL